MCVLAYLLSLTGQFTLCVPEDALFMGIFSPVLLPSIPQGNAGDMCTNYTWWQTKTARPETKTNTC